jgi:hypothetical protein
MELAYHELNQREYELTRHVSLLQVDPVALVSLRTTGQCTVRLPEALFDMDGPGHYFRRIKSVAVSIPSVTGPYASVNCTLTLLKSSIRTSPVLDGDTYARIDAEDARFSDYFGSLQSIVTSSAQNDSGLFEPNLRDERYLPFENSGVISEWQVALPANPAKKEPAQFDYGTITDVILHLRYTAREGGALLRKGAKDHFNGLTASGQGAGAVRLFSVRHDFPTEWSRFRGSTPPAGQRFELAFTVRDAHYPFWAQQRLNNVVHVQLMARSAKPTITVFDKQAGAANSDLLDKRVDVNDPLRGLLVGTLDKAKAALPKPTGEVKLYFEDKELDDLWIALAWSGKDD